MATNPSRSTRVLLLETLRGAFQEYGSFLPSEMKMEGDRLVEEDRLQDFGLALVSSRAAKEENAQGVLEIVFDDVHLVSTESPHGVRIELSSENGPFDWVRNPYTLQFPPGSNNWVKELYHKCGLWNRLLRDGVVGSPRFTPSEIGPLVRTYLNYVIAQRPKLG